MIQLSLLDGQWPGDLEELIPALELMGYHRYWAGEHHQPGHSASPVIVAALAARLSTRLRVGTGGVLLRLTSAVRVAEDFSALELFYPGRVDLGLASAMPGRAHHRQYAQDVRIPDQAGYVDRVRRVVALVRGESIDERAPVPIGPGGAGARRPQLWLCGTGIESARLAGSLGLHFAYHHDLGVRRHGERAPQREVAAAYRDAFVPHEELDAPYLAVACRGSCAPTTLEAHAEWRAHFGGCPDPTGPTFVGSPGACVERLAGLATSYGADELMVDCFSSSLATRLAGLRILSDCWRSWSDAPSLASAA